MGISVPSGTPVAASIFRTLTIGKGKPVTSGWGRSGVDEVCGAKSVR
jgi:hypothetical protein